MLDRLISLNALRKEVERNFDMQNLYLPVHILDVAEDVEEGIVRCKDCVCYKDCIFWNGSHAKCCEKHSLYPDENWFCADGKRKEGR